EGFAHSTPHPHQLSRLGQRRLFICSVSSAVSLPNSFRHDPLTAEFEPRISRMARRRSYSEKIALGKSESIADTQTRRLSAPTVALRRLRITLGDFAQDRYLTNCNSFAPT